MSSQMDFEGRSYGVPRYEDRISRRSRMDCGNVSPTSEKIAGIPAIQLSKAIRGIARKAPNRAHTAVGAIKEHNPISGRCHEPLLLEVGPFVTLVVYGWSSHRNLAELPP